MIYGLCRLWMKSGMCVRTSIGPSAVPGWCKFEFCSHFRVSWSLKRCLSVAAGGPMAVGRSCVLVAVGVSLDPTEYRLRLRCIHNKLLAFTCLELQNSAHKGGAGARAGIDANSSRKSRVRAVIESFDA